MILKRQLTRVGIRERNGFQEPAGSLTQPGLDRPPLHVTTQSGTTEASGSAVTRLAAPPGASRAPLTSLVLSPILLEISRVVTVPCAIY